MTPSAIDRALAALLHQPDLRAAYGRDRDSALAQFSLTAAELAALALVNLPALVAAVELVRAVSPEPIV